MTDPRDAEIARLRMALAESEAAAEGALMILVQTQAERDAALAREAALLASNQANRDLLYQLTGAQSEVTHMRNRFDTAIAGAYEAIKDKLRAVHQKLFAAAEAGDESPEFLGTVASGVSMALEAVHDLTPDGALTALSHRDAALAQVARLRAVVEFYERLTGTIGTVALSRRDAQMRAEGRKEGMREAADAVQVGYDNWAGKPHNAKWVRKIEGTPISNDLPVCIRTAILAAAEKTNG